MDDKSSSVNAVLNCSRRASALEESDVQTLLFCIKGGTPVDSDRSYFKYDHAFLIENEFALLSGVIPPRTSLTAM